MLNKEKAKRAAEVVLEAAHKLEEKDVPAWIAKNFDSTWDSYDQNSEGWIRYEESHTFMRSLMGTLNKFSLAPGSISDLTSGANNYDSLVWGHGAPTKVETTP